MKLLHVTWIDAVGSDGWTEIEKVKLEKPVTHYSVGYLVNDQKDFITISMSYDEKKENMGAWLCIPKQFIIKKRIIVV